MVRQKRTAGSTAARLLALVCVLCLLVSLGAVTALATGEATVRVGTATAERDTTVDLTIKLESNPGIWGMKLRIHYDPDVLTLKSVKAGSIFTQDELTTSEDLSKLPYVVIASGSQLKNKTANGTLVTLRFAVSAGAASGSYPVTVEVVQANNVDGQSVAVSTEKGKVTVVDCLHADKQWQTTTAATCEAEGTEVQTCTKCGTTFETRPIAATGHVNAEIRDAKEATTTEEGYTGDIYCKDCGTLLAQGTVIPMIPVETEPTQPTEPSTPAPSRPQILSGGDQVFRKDSAKDLVVVSDAPMDEFVRVEIDGKELPKDAYTVSGDNTVLTVKAAYLDTLREGKHSLSIVSSGGVAGTGFTVEKAAEKGPGVWPFILLGVLIVAEAGAVGLLISRKRRA